eukprot:COSAG01_NODE_58720_length_304_cov_0.995122_1_plen_73_part_01
MACGGHTRTHTHPQNLSPTEIPKYNPCGPIRNAETQPCCSSTASHGRVCQGGKPVGGMPLPGGHAAHDRRRFT